MSRSSIRTFLVTAKQHLRQTLKEQGQAAFVIGNESADLDSITCALLYSYVESSKDSFRRRDKLMIPVTNIPASDLPLRPELTALLQHAGIKPSELITLDDLGAEPLPAENTEWTLVDHNSFQGYLGQLYSHRVVATIDHHEDEHGVPKHARPRIIETSGSCNSLLVKYLKDSWDSLSSSASTVGAVHGQDDELIDDFAYTSTWDAQVAKLSLGAVLVDTADMKDENKVTDHDVHAVRYLEARIHVSPRLGKDFDRRAFFNEITAAREDLDDMSVEDILRKDYKQWTEGRLTLGTAAVVKPIEYLKQKDGSFEKAVEAFAKQRSLDVMAISTAYTDDSGNFRRQLFLAALGGGSAKEAADRFASTATKELELEKADEGQQAETEQLGFSFKQFWHQKNLAASRKQVAPLVRQALRQK